MASVTYARSLRHQHYRNTVKGRLDGSALTFHFTPLARISGHLVQLVEQIPDRGHRGRVELVHKARVDRDADTACTRMDAEGRLQQVVAVFRYLGIDTRVGVLQDDILEGSLVFALVISAPSAGRIIALTKSGD